MKILFVSATEYAIEHFAGPYILALQKAGHEIHVLTGGEIGNYQGPESVVRKAIGLKRKPSPFSDLKELFSLTRYIRKHKFSVIYSISPKGGLIGQMAAKLAMVKHRVHFVTGQTWKTRSGIGRWGLKKLDWLICQLVSKAYVDSRSQAEFLIEQKVLKRRKANVLASGSVSGVVVNEFLFSQEKRDRVRAQYNITDENVLIFFLGRISSVKGVTDLVEAFAQAYKRNDQLRLLVVGPDDGDADAVASKIKQHGLEQVVTATGTSTPRPAVQYSAADIFCVPSYMEGFGNVVLESACAGVPTIGSDIYGLQDAIVDGETGLRYELGNISELADKLVQLANDEPLRKQLGQNALARVKAEFAQEHLVKAFIEAHAQMVEPTAGAQSPTETTR